MAWNGLSVVDNGQTVDDDASPLRGSGHPLVNKKSQKERYNQE